MSVASRELSRVDTSRRTLASLLAAALFCGLLAGQLVSNGRGVAVLALAALVVPLVLWQRPQTAPVVIVIAALVIEQFPQVAATGFPAVTARIPLFHGLGGYRLSDLLLLGMAAVWLMKRGTGTVAELPRSAVLRALAAFVGTVIFALLLGVATGGAIAPAVTEARPFLYLALAYLVTSTTITSLRAIRAVLWAIVLGTGLKAAQLLYAFLSVRELDPRPEAILGHEESLSFALFILLTIALWLYEVPGPLRRSATALLPVVIAADLANGRRVAWLIFTAGLVVVIVVGIVSLPRRRRFLKRLVVVLALAAAVYFPAYWDKGGGFAQPARAFRSAFDPTPRDALSNLYRIQEEENLKFNIRAAGPLGKGFGHRIDYALPIEDISDIDPYIVYVPHNGIFYIFLRLGVLGAIAFWSLVAVAIIAACRLARRGEKELGVVGMLGAAAITSYLLLGYNDQGFFYFRVAFIIGVLLGLVEAGTRLARADAPAVAPPAVPRARALQRAVVSRTPAAVKRVVEQAAQRRARHVARLLLPVAIGMLIYELSRGMGG